MSINAGEIEHDVKIEHASSGYRACSKSWAIVEEDSMCGCVKQNSFSMILKKWLLDFHCMLH